MVVREGGVGSTADDREVGRGAAVGEHPVDASRTAASVTPGASTAKPARIGRVGELAEHCSSAISPASLTSRSGPTTTLATTVSACSSAAAADQMVGPHLRVGREPPRRGAPTCASRADRVSGPASSDQRTSSSSGTSAAA